MTAALKNGGSYHGATAGSDAEKSTCYTQTGPAALLYLHADATQNARIDVKSAKSSSDPSASDAAVLVRTDCLNELTEFACNAKAATTPTYAGIDMDLNTLKFSGDVYITVAGAFFDAGFDLTLTSANSCFGNGDCTSYESATCNQLTSVCHTHLPCPDGTADCDKDPSNGCEVTIKGSDLNHCGSCSNVCPTGGQHQTGVACVAGTCVLACEAGWGDCDGSGGSGCESNLMTSSLACGGCGKSCEGGLCNDTSCGPAAETIATLPKQPADGWIIHLEVGANNIYAEAWDPGGSTTLSFAPKSVSAVGQTIPTNVLYDFTASADALWWIDLGTVHKRTSDGTTSTVLSPDSMLDPRFIFSDGSNVWLLENSVATQPTTDASVRLLPSGSTTTQILWTQKSGEWTGGAFNGTDLVVRGLGWSGFAYNEPDATFEWIAKAGSPTAFGTLTRVVPIAIDASTVYYGGDALYSLPFGGSMATKLWTPPAGGVFSIAVDDSNVYFAECANDYQPARVRRIKKSGGAADVIASDSVGNYGFASQYCDYNQDTIAYRVLALDQGYVYWANGDNIIRRLAK